ncbi:MAG: hypothetical protein V4651_10000 [Bacteroidota bacterium]
MRFFFCILLFGVCVSCDNTLQVYGDDYVETAVIYGVIDMIQDSQFVRVNKTFRNTTAAAEALSIYDSLCFEEVKVELTFLPANQTVTLEPIARPGISSNRRDIFAISTNQCDLNAEKVKLTVTNAQTGKQFSATQKIISPPVFSRPMQLQFSSQLNIIGFTYSNGNSYNGTVRMYYTENNGSGNVEKFFDYPIPRSTLSGGLHIEVKGPDWLYSAITILGNGNGISRKLTSFSFYISAESEDMDAYQQLRIPSIQIVQKNPLYTNIEGGIGLFTVRGSAEQKNVPPDAGMKLLLKQKLNIDS